MLSILINAYACSPNMGSEPGMAWNWCINLARHCELYIITEGEFRDKIEAVLPTLPQGKHMHFYYNPVSEEVRKMCWNQGDWRFYKHYKKWQWKTYEMAQEIIVKQHIDIVHQLNMIGFREMCNMADTCISRRSHYTMSEHLLLTLDLTDRSLPQLQVLTLYFLMQFLILYYLHRSHHILDQMLPH